MGSFTRPGEGPAFPVIPELAVLTFTDLIWPCVAHARGWSTGTLSENTGQWTHTHTHTYTQVKGSHLCEMALLPKEEKIGI